MCPSLPSSKRRPWQPKPVERGYQAHSVRTPLYDTARWRTLRKAQLQREPLCRRCQADARLTPASVVDHIKPVNQGGDFWDTANHQSLCQSCHQRKSAHERWQPRTSAT